MDKGRIIFLNGVTSSGKTSIVEALQDRDDVFFYVVANDLFQEMVGEKFLRENYWKHLAEVRKGCTDEHMHGNFTPSHCTYIAYGAVSGRSTEVNTDEQRST
jgi:Ni2+-binding GTPase involved in maturation of urease and hydrogenase